SACRTVCAFFAVAVAASFNSSRPGPAVSAFSSRVLFAAPFCANAILNASVVSLRVSPDPSLPAPPAVRMSTLPFNVSSLGVFIPRHHFHFSVLRRHRLPLVALYGLCGNTPPSLRAGDPSLRGKIRHNFFCRQHLFAGALFRRELRQQVFPVAVCRQPFRV